jgi:hypothetical protein
MGAADRIAETILKMGQIRAEGLQHAADAQARAQANSAQIWGGALQSLGQIPGEVAKYKLADTENQIRQQQLATQKRYAQGEQDANWIYQGLMKPGPDGTVNIDESTLPKLQAGMANAGVPLEVQDRTVNSLKSVMDANTSFRQSQLDHQVKIAKAVLAGVTPDHPLTPGSALATLKMAQTNGIANAHDVDQFMAAMNQGHDPADLFKAIIQYGTQPPSALEQAKLRNETLQGNKLEAEIPGAAAKSAQEQNVVAGMQGGLTADQVADNARQAAAQQAQAAAAQATEAARVAAAGREDQRIGLERQRVGMEGQRIGLEQQKFQQSQVGAPSAVGVGVPDVPVGQKNEDFLKTLPTPIAAQVKALVEGRQAFPQGAALRSDYWQNMLGNVAKYDPSFDAVNYNARSKTRADFTSGKAAQQVNAINTVIGHLSGLSDAAEALNNSDLPMFNSIANTLSKATGSPKVTNFDTIKKAVSDEVTRVWRQSGGSEADIQAAQKNLDASGSPAQLRGAIATYADLLQSKLGSLNEQYRQGMGTDKIDMITPKAQQALDAIEKRAGRTPVASGASVKAPNGQTYTFPTAADAAAFKARAGIK